MNRTWSSNVSAVLLIAATVLASCGGDDEASIASTNGEPAVVTAEPIETDPTGEAPTDSAEPS